jgi:branched-chain amino acid transport system substrate-binding protein
VINIIAEAIERAGSDDPEAIRAALEKTEYHGLNGTMMFSEEKHQAYGHNMYMARIENGKPVLAVSSKLENPE